MPSIDPRLTAALADRYRVTYPTAGSFVKFLLERHGYALMLELFRNSSFDAGPSELRSDFRDAFGEEIDDA